jgi:ATP-binding cassette subfamily B protein
MKVNNKIDKSAALRTVHFYWQELKRHKLLVFLALALMPAEIFLLSFAVPFIVAQIIDILTVQSITPDQVWPVFGPYVLATAAATLVGLIFQTINGYAGWILVQRAQYNLGQQAFHALSEQSMHFHNNRFGGSLVSQTSRFVSAFDSLFDAIADDIIPILCNIIFVIVMCWSISWQFVVILLVLIVVYTVIAYFAYRKTYGANIELTDAYNANSGQLADSVSNIQAVKSYGREKFERKLFQKTNGKIYRKAIRLIVLCLKRDSIFNVVVLAITVSAVVFMVGGNAWLGISIGAIVMLFTYTQQILSKLWSVNNIMRRVNSSMGNAYEMTKILDEPRMVVDAPQARKLTVGPGEVKFDHITFQYADGNETVLDDLTIRIKPGQRVGFVGHSGSGKTTVTKLLLRFADVNSGAILIDGQDIKKVTQESLRHSIAYVPQETNLFHRTIAENIAYGRPKATREEIIWAAEQANAWEFIEKLPQGLETMVGERGVKLSGGQRQRVAIARAILKDAPILVLDEATSALDTESEKLIQAALTNLMKGRTSVVIAHRLSTVAELDRIIVLDEGRIIEDGKHVELIKNGGKYAKLWNRQTGLSE